MTETMGLKKPPHSTISSIVRILESTGFLDHKAYGRTYEYFPKITKEAYSKTTLKKFVSDYFEGSMSSLVSFMVKEKNLNIHELESLIDNIQEEE
jgi:predicted transcriptional regulator